MKPGMQQVLRQQYYWILLQMETTARYFDLKTKLEKILLLTPLPTVPVDGWLYNAEGGLQRGMNKPV